MGVLSISTHPPGAGSFSFLNLRNLTIGFFSLERSRTLFDHPGAHLHHSLPGALPPQGTMIALSLLLFQGIFLREPVDKVGYATQQEQIQAIIQASKKVKSYITLQKQAGPVVGVICPHDDHLYAGPLYLQALKEIKAKKLIIFGVAHKAWRWKIKDRLIFEDYDGFKTPGGFIAIDKALREFVIKNLHKKHYTLCRSCQAEEHSIEGILPFIAYFHPDVEIFPILVPYMHFDTMEEIAQDLSEIMDQWLSKHNLTLGKDLQVIISSDAVHYGDQGWNGKNYAPFGTDCQALTQAIKRDMDLSKNYLSNIISKNKLKDLLYTLVDKNDLEKYKITWCGRFSIPFGTLFLKNLSSLGHTDIVGVPVAYGTSVQIGQILEDKKGLGVTAPANLHHWVGYLALKFILKN